MSCRGIIRGHHPAQWWEWRKAKFWMIMLSCVFTGLQLIIHKAFKCILQLIEIAFVRMEIQNNMVREQRTTERTTLLHYCTKRIWQLYHMIQISFIFHAAAMKIDQLLSPELCKRLSCGAQEFYSSLGHKEVIVVCGGFIASRERGSDFTLCWTETKRFPIQSPDQEMKSHLHTHNGKHKAKH